MGSQFKLRTKAETTAGTAATGNYDQVPCFAFSVAATQPLESDAVLSATSNRDGGDPNYGAVSVSGDARVPLDTVHIGRWLRLLLGAPTTTGTTDYTHVFRSGSASIPSNSFEKAFPDISRYEMLTGVRANTMAVRMAPDGAAEATFGLLGLSETASGTSGAGTPVVTSFSRFFAVQGSIKRAGSALAAVTAFEMNFTNDMEAVAAIRDDYRMEDIDLGLAGASGTVTVRFSDHDLYTAAAAGQEPAELEALYTIDATTSLSFKFSRAFLARQGRAIEGPRGITQNFRWVAGPDTTNGVMTVTLENAVASYA
jgi:hypothetical protein